MNLVNLYSEIWKIRSALENVGDFASSLDFIRTLSGFPEGCCGISTNLIYLYLQDISDFKNCIYRYCCIGSFNDSETGGGHDWIKINKLYVDITGDQFGKDKVIISDINPWIGRCSYYSGDNETEFGKFPDEILPSYEKVIKFIKDFNS